MIPNEVKYIINTLIKNGYTAYIVGGAVRNTVMNRPVKDWDITTSALPSEVEALFDKTYNVGKSFGTIIVKLDQNYEVTTYRTEDEYDGRKPHKIEFSNHVLDDLKRRDFTMNAMIMSLDGKITDYFKGQEDINHKIIQTVGNPIDRFTEDYLRVYRYVRFTNEYDLSLNEAIDKTIIEMPINYNISAERIREEFNKMILSKRPSNAIKHLNKVGLLEYIMPEIISCIGFEQHSKFHHLDVFEHTMKALDETPPELTIRLATLCHDIGKPESFELVDNQGRFYGHDKASVTLADKFLSRLKYDNKIKEDVLLLVGNHMRLLDLDNKKSVKKFIKKIGENRLDAYLQLRRADILSSTTNDTLESVEKMRLCFKSILESKEPISLNDLAINGHDLMSLGYEGKQIGMIKKHLLEIILDKPELNNKESLLKLTKEINL